MNFQKLPILKKKTPKNLYSSINPPFLSAVKRSLPFQNNSHSLDIPGPGKYQIAKSLLEPIITTVKKGENAYIVKLNQIGSSSFRGQERRFNHNQVQQLLPGPGQYDSYKQHKQIGQIQRNPSIKQSINVYKQKFKDIFKVKKQKLQEQNLVIGVKKRKQNVQTLILKRRLSNYKLSKKQMNETPILKSYFKTREKQFHPNSVFASQSNRQIFQQTYRYRQTSDVKKTQKQDLFIDGYSTLEKKYKFKNQRLIKRQNEYTQNKYNTIDDKQIIQNNKMRQIKIGFFKEKKIDEIKELIKSLKSLDTFQGKSNLQSNRNVSNNEQFHHLRYYGNIKLQIELTNLQKETKKLKIFDTQKII